MVHIIVQDLRLNDHSMARTSKFSFPLPGRRSNPIHFTNDDEQGFEESGQFTNLKSTKAQRLLGTSDFDRVDSRQQRPKPVKALKQKPSFVSISISEFTHDHTTDGDEIYDHADVVGRTGTQCRSPQGICPRPSSPLLGRHYHPSRPSGSSGAESNTRADLLSGELRESRSSSTLRSYYDPNKSPLSVSQQTSASSARDMALRKGCATISTSLDQSNAQRAVTSAGDSTSKDNMFGDDGTRRRPPRLNFSKLFPRPRTSQGVLLSPHRVTKSPSALSVASESPPPTPPHRKEMWLKFNRSKDSVSARSGQSTPSFASPVEPTFKSKLNVKKPKQGIRNWFDGLEDSEALDGPSNSIASSEVVNTKIDHRFERKSTLSHSSQRTLTRENTGTQPNLQRFRPSDAQLCSPSRSWEGNRMYSPTSSKSKNSKTSNRSIFTNSDLQNQSVLALSSSEDEEEEVELSKCIRQPGVREFAASYGGNDHATGEKAQTYPVLNLRTTYTPSDSMQSRSSTTSTRYGTFPGSDRRNNTTFLTSPSTSHSRRPRTSGTWTIESRPENLRPRSSNAGTPGNPKISIDSISLPPSPSSSECRFESRKSRMMAVTREEESLLEAMRHKRAIMREGKSGQSHDQTRRQDGTTPSIGRPRADVTEFHDENKQPEDTQPPTISVCTYSPALSDRVSCSTDPGLLDDVSTASAGSKTTLSPFSYLSVPKFSPGIQFIPSEYQSSTPTSRASPKTPPSKCATPDALIDSIGTDLSLGGGGSLTDTGMESCKAQIGSGGIVELDVRE